ncbi:MAG: hypothetical protein NDJ92_06310 [Thermoanaerobaculia bacterium]|nr:hypothetical protein [Thermoanaerobaculia bacterium]
MSRRRLRTEAAALVILVAVVLIPFLDVLFASGRFYVRDLTRYYYPTKQILREIVLGGEFPYWNRYYSAGQPIAANPEYEVFYPPQWLILLPDYDLGYRLHIIVHIPIAAIGMYLLLRSLRLRIPAAFFGGVIFAIGGVSLSMINLLPILFCVVWIPYVLLFTRRFLRAPNLRDFALAAFFLGIQGLVGEPTSILQTALLMSAYGLWRAVRSDRPFRDLVRNTVLVGAIGLCGFLGGAAQLVPAADHVGDSIRSRPFDFGLITTWSLPAARPLELVYPQIFGRLFDKPGSYWGASLYPRTASPFIFSIYLGLLAAAMIVAAFATRVRGWIFAVALLAATVPIALGGNTPLFAALHELGLTQSIRYPEKFAYAGLFALNVLAAIAFDRYLRRDRRVWRVALVFASASALAAAVFFFATFTPLYETLVERVWAITNPERVARAIGIAREGWGLAALRGAALAGLLAVGMRRRRATWHFAAIALLLLDLVPVGFDVLPRFPAKFFTPPEVVAEIAKEDKPFRIFHEADWYGGSQPSNSYFGVGPDAYWVVRNGIYPMTTATWGIETVLERDYDKTALLPTVDLVDAMWRTRDAGVKNWREIFGSMSNVGYVAQYRDFEEEKKRVGGNFKKSRPIDFVPQTPSPRYYFASRLIEAADADVLVRRLVKGDWCRDCAYVAGGAGVPATGRVLSVVETANRARIEVEADGDAYLVMSVTPHKYWTARIDGRAAPIETANVAYQGLRVPRGRHVVEVEYRNTLVQRSAAVSAFVLGGALLAAALPRRRRPAVESGQ